MKIRFLKRAVAFVSLFGSAVAVFGDPPSSQPAPDVVVRTNTTAPTFSSEVAEATASLKEKFDAHRTTAEDLAENIKALNELIVKHANDADREQLGRLYLLEAHIYADGLGDTNRAQSVWTYVSRIFPGTRAAHGAQLSLARLNAELAAKAAAQFPTAKGNLPVLILPSLMAGLETFSDVIITNVSSTDISFAHSEGFTRADPETLDRTSRMLLAGALFTASRPPILSDGPEVLAPQIYARSFINQPAPQFIAESWITPAPNTLGKFVLVEFWATWCEPCKGEIGRLNELAGAYQDKLVVIGLSDESAEAVHDFWRDNPPSIFGQHAMTRPRIKYSVAVDTRKRMKQSVGVFGIPHSLLIDPKGIVRFEGMPHYLIWNDAGLKRLLAKYSQ